MPSKSNNLHLLHDLDAEKYCLLPIRKQLQYTIENTTSLRGIN
jgi:hypothetical protein